MIRHKFKKWEKDKEKKEKNKKEKKEKKSTKWQKHGKLASYRSSRQVTKISFLGSVDKNLHQLGSYKGFWWVSSQWCPVRSEQEMDQSWLGINPVVFLLFSFKAPLHLGKRSLRDFSLNILETDIHFVRN